MKRILKKAATILLSTLIIGATNALVIISTANRVQAHDVVRERRSHRHVHRPEVERPSFHREDFRREAVRPVRREDIRREAAQRPRRPVARRIRE